MRRKTVEDIFYDGISAKRKCIIELEKQEQTPLIMGQIKDLKDAIEMLIYDLTERKFRQQWKRKNNI